MNLKAIQWAEKKGENPFCYDEMKLALLALSMECHEACKSRFLVHENSVQKAKRRSCLSNSDWAAAIHNLKIAKLIWHHNPSGELADGGPIGLRVR